MTDWVYYYKAKDYGKTEYTGYTPEGTPVPGHSGGFMACPKCASPMTVAQEQIERVGEPCSIIHSGFRHDRLIQREKVHCGAHFKTRGPEVQANSDEFPKTWPAWILEDFYEQAPNVWKRQVEWC